MRKSCITGSRWVLPAVWLLAVVTCVRADLQEQVRGAINSANIGQTEVSVTVQDLSTGRTLVAINPDEPMLPASNMKLVTTAAALKILGPNFVFRTELRRIEPAEWTPAPIDGAAPGVEAPAQAGTPHGTVLVIKGDGDPGFGDPELLRLHNMDVDQLLQVWVDAVEKAGIKSVERLVVDDRVFDRRFVNAGWPAEQLSSWYCAQVAGINFYDNCIDVFADPGAMSQPPRIRLIPATPYVNVINRASTATVDTFWITRKAESNDVTAWGKLKTRRRQAINVTVHDPPLFFANTLAARLADRGITVGSITRPDADDRLPEGKLLHAVENELGLIVARCNKDSQNLFAESLLKRVGRAVTGEPGSWENGSAAIRLFLRGILGPQAAAVIVADGSGLGRGNRISSRAFVDLLKAMHDDPRVAGVYRNSLSVGGNDGTLERRFHKDMTSRVYGKSGYINGVSTLSGYLVVPDSSPVGEHVIAFSFLFNNFKPPVYPHTVKAIQDRLVTILDRSFNPPTAAPAASPAAPRQGG
ncbi:MAG: D-alanyl-D-alanine carboxypeptidase/D-alanyl-D-alanine-endopeptidase [Planctomycetes bacterium]|nr:D-alanyl-D-alanine carboxypeptidase/D-alanyl-D-alanine-endopeptidase [Planctomycetota bacterium]